MSNDKIKEKWMAILKDILKYAVGAIVGGISTAISGCAVVPVFDI